MKDMQGLWKHVRRRVSRVAVITSTLVALLFGGVVASGGPARAATSEPCDIYAAAGTPCVAAYSMTRALSATYTGPLYQVRRASDGTTRDITLLAAGGDVNATVQDSFCSGTQCVITEIYDQSGKGNNLSVEAVGHPGFPSHIDTNPFQPSNAAALPMTIGGHEAYGLDIEPGNGYRTPGAGNQTATNGQPEGMYMVASGTHVNSGCCFDFGNTEATNKDTGSGHMDALNLSTICGPSCGSGPWVAADLENGIYGWDKTKPVNYPFVTAMLQNSGHHTLGVSQDYAVESGNAVSGGLTTDYAGPFPANPTNPDDHGTYSPMQQEGGIVLGTGGDGSNSANGSFFEGVMTKGTPTTAASNTVQANIVAAGYGGDSSPVTPAPSAAGQAVVHNGDSSVFTANSGTGDLEETFLTALGSPWQKQDLTAKYGTPPVKPGTRPVTLVHCGITSVFSVNAGSGDLEETFLTALGNPWVTQDLTAKYSVPPTDVTPTAVLHANGAGSTSCDGYASVYSVNAGSGDLEETFLSAVGNPWQTQDLTAKYTVPAVRPGTSPVALVHCGVTSVYTVNSGSGHLEETFLPSIGANWTSQDLSGNYGTPPTDVTPTAVFHTAGAGDAINSNCPGFTSVYTVDSSNRHLQETYLANAGFPGDAWGTQDLNTVAGTPLVAPGTQPVALVHLNFTSVYTVNQGTGHLEETYLPIIILKATSASQPWKVQDMTDAFGTPQTDQSPIALLHPNQNGSLDTTSVYTVDEFSNNLDETFLPGTGFPGDPWQWQDLSAKYGTPPVAVLQSSPSSWSVAHTGYTSVYTVDPATVLGGGGDLEETYLPAMGAAWSHQDLSQNYGTPQAMTNVYPQALVHDGYTSVFTVNAGTLDLEETYLPALGSRWHPQDLSTGYGTPEILANTTPSALYHDGVTSVFTINASNSHLEETYLPGLGKSWAPHDLSSLAGTPAVQAGSSPTAIFHDGYVSVYTVAANGDLWETYLPALGGPWHSQDLTANYGTPAVAGNTSPTAVFHNGFTSVYTVDKGSNDLQETWLPAIDAGWTTQNLTTKYSVPTVLAGASPAALYHTGYTSVYYPGSDFHLDEAYLPALSTAWASQDLTSAYGTPPTYFNASPLVHYAANGALTWTSVYSIGNNNSNHLEETYLPAITGPSWTTQDLSQAAGTPGW